MEDLRTQLLDVALDIVGTEGLSGLSQAAVDAAAAVPAGSTAGFFPSRDALVAGVAERCIEREQEMVCGDGSGIEASPEALARSLGGFVDRAVGPDRGVTLARYALQVATAQSPSMRGLIAGGAARVDTWAVDLVRQAGSSHPERDMGILANYVTGLVFHEIALPSDQDATARIGALIDTLCWSTP